MPFTLISRLIACLLLLLPLHRTAAEASHGVHGMVLFGGHDERDGSTRERQAEVMVERVILYRSLSAQPVERPVSHYVPVGDFLVKLIDSRPDFDHIVLLRRAAVAPVDVPKRGVEENERELARHVPLAGTVYYDTADLR